MASQSHMMRVQYVKFESIQRLLPYFFHLHRRTPKRHVRSIGKTRLEQHWRMPLNVFNQLSRKLHRETMDRKLPILGLNHGWKSTWFISLWPPTLRSSSIAPWDVMTCKVVVSTRCWPRSTYSTPVPCGGPTMYQWGKRNIKDLQAVFGQESAMIGCMMVLLLWYGIAQYVTQSVHDSLHQGRNNCPELLRANKLFMIGLNEIYKPISREIDLQCDGE